MIQTIIQRLQQISGVKVKEGFYQQNTKGDKFILLQPHQIPFGQKTADEMCHDTLHLMVVIGIDVSRTQTPTTDLINLVRDVREQFYKQTRDISKPDWLKEYFKDKPSNLISFAESLGENSKFIMPESHEKHGLAVITLEIKTTHPLGERL